MTATKVRKKTEERTISPYGAAAEEAARFTADIKTLVARAESTSVTTPEQAREATELIREIRSRSKVLSEKRLSLTRPLDQTKKGIIGLFNPAQEMLELGERILRGEMLAWTEEQERIRREQEAKARQAAAEEERLLRQQAQELRDDGQDVMAEAKEAEADLLPVPVVITHAKPEGVSTRKTWQATITDKTALIKGVAEGRVPEAVLDVNMTVLNQLARSLKGGMRFPGVEAREEETVVVRDTGPPPDLGV